MNDLILENCKRCINYEMCQSTGCNVKNEVQKLLEELNTCMIERNKYLDKLEKAIEFVEDYRNQWTGEEVEYNMMNLLSILKGDDKE